MLGLRSSSRKQRLWRCLHIDGFVDVEASAIVEDRAGRRHLAGLLEAVGVDNCVATQSGSAAYHGGLDLLEVKCSSAAGGFR